MSAMSGLQASKIRSPSMLEHDHQGEVELIGRVKVASLDVMNSESRVWAMTTTLPTEHDAHSIAESVVGAAGRDRLAERIAELHPWSGPEISATPVPWTTEKYAQWVESPTGPQE
ncbi:hypothetical protein BOX37_17605 [Nocardia mangyaensis]|uniref:Uncharacterized protein n=1 Tax=Nocardia mangyaensis TaxID=2213200 RepID=A0A1J0VTV4_9NOCA|nr:divalent cation tolerance protein CutA [Nocardia mangyaensis]APE35462.1 hypothetical protein BOX37_17605 [Nocardia mangyaensis]